MAERHLSYALLKCADEERDEALNVGLVLFDDGKVVARVVESLTRIERTLPNVPIAHVRLLLTNAVDHLQASLRSAGIEALMLAHQEWNNTLRISRVRSILAESADEAADMLFERYVAAPLPAIPATPDTPSSSGADAGPHRLSSKLVVRSLTSRLRQRRLQEGQHYRLGARFTGFTRSNVPVPVFFPIEAFGFIYFDGIDVNPAEEDRTLDIARAMTQKAEETFRAQDRAMVSIAVKDTEGSRLGAQVEEIIEGAEHIRGHVPLVRRYSNVSELDALLKQTLVESPANQMEIEGIPPRRLAQG